MKFVKMFKIEFIKLKKNYSLFIYFITFIFVFTILSFTLHLTRIGNKGNLQIPINITYSGFIFYIGFAISIYIIMLVVDGDIKDEVKTKKIYLLLTQSINRFDYFLGKTFFWFFVALIWLIIVAFLSYFYANVIFSGRTPILASGQYMNSTSVLLNFILNLIAILPSVYIFIIIAFVAGYFITLQSLNIVFFTSFLIIILIFHIDRIIIPFKFMKIYNNRFMVFKFPFFSTIIFFILTIIISFITIVIFKKLVYKKNF